MATYQELERNIEFEFVRATENAALNAIHWLGRGNKEAADEAACDAINGVFDLADIRGEVVIGEGLKDKAPGICLGDRLGKGGSTSPRFDIALDPIDGTTNMAKGLPNSISVMAAAHVPEGHSHGMVNIPSFYSEKLSYGPAVKEAISRAQIPPLTLSMHFEEIMTHVAAAMKKRVSELVVVVPDRPRNQRYVDVVRSQGASLRLIYDGDIAAAVAPALPDSGVDLFVGVGGSPEGILTAAALKALGGEIYMRMWPHTDEERTKAADAGYDVRKVMTHDDLVKGENCFFSATGVTDGDMLQGVHYEGSRGATTESLVMRSRSGTVRRIASRHDRTKLRELTGYRLG